MNPRPLYECQRRFIQSELLLILSFSFRKGEPNAAFLVSIELPVWVLEAISSIPMARANCTCHVPFREHPDVDIYRFPSLACVERRRSGPNRISRPAAMSKFVKSRATRHRHVPFGTMYIAVDGIIPISVIGLRQTKFVQSKSVQPFEHKKQRVKTRATWHVARIIMQSTWIYFGH